MENVNVRQQQPEFFFTRCSVRSSEPAVFWIAGWLDRNAEKRCVGTRSRQRLAGNFAREQWRVIVCVVKRLASASRVLRVHREDAETFVSRTTLNKFSIPFSFVSKISWSKR